MPETRQMLVFQGEKSIATSCVEIISPRFYAEEGRNILFLFFCLEKANEASNWEKCWKKGCFCQWITANITVLLPTAHYMLGAVQST